MSETRASRLACVFVPALPLQLLLRQHPKWAKHPVAIVEQDRPQAKLLWVNERARRVRILPGMRFAAARSLATDLRAAVVAETKIEEAIGDLFAALHAFSPRVEPSREVPGCFWIDPGGLARLYGSHHQWAESIRRQLASAGWTSTVVVGFHRYRVQAIARIERACVVVPDPAREARMAAAVPLARLSLSASLRDELRALGITTLGAFMALPAGELRSRFGNEAHELRRVAEDDAWSPLQARELVDPIEATIQFDPPEEDHARLLFRLKPLLRSLVERLAEKSMAMSAVRVSLDLDHAGTHVEQIEPAAPTLDTVQVLDLIRLRLAATTLPAGIESLELGVEGQLVDAKQLALFNTRQRRDLMAGDRALARLRAAYGPSAVVQARLRPAHLPEASFCWEPLKELKFPKLPPPPDPEFDHPANDTHDADPLPLCRALYERPRPIPTPRRTEPDGWQLGPERGAVVSLDGPFRLSGGWWVRTVERDYYYAKTQRGDMLWIFFDRPRRKWFLHGEVG